MITRMRDWIDYTRNWGPLWATWLIILPPEVVLMGWAIFPSWWWAPAPVAVLAHSALWAVAAIGGARNYPTALKVAPRANLTAIRGIGDESKGQG